MKSGTKKLIGVGLISLMLAGVFAGLIVSALSYTDVTIKVTYNEISISSWHHEAEVKLIDLGGHYVQNKGTTSGGSITFFHIPNGQYIVSITWYVSQNFTRWINGGSQVITVDLT